MPDSAIGQERQLLRTLIDNLPDFIFVKDTQGRYVLSNRAHAIHLGMSSPDEVIGKTDHDFYPAERADDFRADELHIIRYGQPMLEHEIRVIEPQSGQKRWYALTKVPLINAQDEVTAIVGMIRDITQHKAGEEALKLANTRLTELNDLKSHFLLTMSHELRTPLNSIIGYTDMLLSEILGALNDKQRDRLERVERNAANLLALIDDVLDISRIQTGQMQLHLQALDCARLLKRYQGEFQPQALAQGLEIKLDLDPQLAPIYGDEEAITKIMRNLIGNALKFTREGVIILGSHTLPSAKAIALEPDLGFKIKPQDYALLSVQDTGIGISAEVQRHLFDEFRQVDGSATREHGGTGLGLALCYKLIKLMGGYIWLESYPGMGTTFYLLLPLAG